MRKELKLSDIQLEHIAVCEKRLLQLERMRDIYKDDWPRTAEAYQKRIDSLLARIVEIRLGINFGIELSGGSRE